MSILGMYEKQAVENVIYGSDFKNEIVSRFGHSEINLVPGQGDNNGVQKEVSFEFVQEDFDKLEELFYDTPNIKDLEKAIRSENDDLAMELASDVFDDALDEWHLVYGGVLDRKKVELENVFNELVNEQDVFLMGNGSESMTLFELYGERDYDEVYVEIIVDVDTSYIGDKAIYVYEAVHDSMARRGLLEGGINDNYEDEEDEE